ncbi:LPS-assembly protein LptD [Pelagibacterales bacterium SAG-MED33]|nr:LPS-assembly protein LptD [Pelagibacterales bacterium SAG-MED33]
MLNKFKILIFIIVIFQSNILLAQDQFIFDITEIEIKENGNKFYGLKRGTITTNSGLVINADKFIYDKILNILDAQGDVKIIDKFNNYIIYTNKITYLKNDEIIFTKGDSKALNDNTIILAEEFKYLKKNNLLIAKNKVKIDDPDENIVIFSQEITYDQNKNVIFTEGFTEARVQNKYNFYSKNVFYNKQNAELSSKKKTQVLDDKYNLYELDKFNYSKKEFLLKGENVKIKTNFNSNINSDEYFFESGFFDLNNRNFNAGKTKISMQKSIFGNIENDPRLFGVTSFKEGKITQVNKGIFTSCKKREGCPPWSIEAQKIIHDKKKKQLIYDHAFIKVYDFPIVYFPKFFHPDPTVKRQSGLLKPILNESETLGSSLQLPYFKILSTDRDITFRPNIFNNNIFMLQNEYREKTENSTLIADFAFTNGYKSSLSNKKKSISHLFAKYKSNLNLNNFISSKLNINLEKVTNDTYLKVFDGNLSEMAVRPDKNNLVSSIDLSLEHDDFNFSTGLTSYETLSGKNSDRYQYVLPYFNFSKSLFENQNLFNISLNSSGSNNLKNTNSLRSRIVNDLNIESNDYIFDSGLKNKFGTYLKNLNSTGKNDDLYKSSPQVELMGIFEMSSSLPLIKYGEIFNDYIEPKISFRFNPSDMKDHSNSSRKINTSNIFEINRLGLTDTFEEGKSLTIGFEYKKERIENINNYFGFKVGSVFRHDDQVKIPSSSSIKQSGDLIGSIQSNLNKNLNFSYDFAIDNNYKTFEYNSFNADFNFNKFSTGIKFIEENGKIGDANSIENTLRYNFDENNYLSFNTRRNRKISFTEYYNLIYEYKNDCLTAGIKYNKTYYQDRDLLPTENFMISITLFPLTTYESNFDGIQ